MFNSILSMGIFFKMEFLFFCFILFLFLVCIFYKKYWNNIDFTNIIIIHAMLIILGFCIHILFLIFKIKNESFLIIYYSSDFFSLYCKLFILILTFFYLMLCLNYFKHAKYAIVEFPILILFSTLGMFFIIGSNDFFVLFLGLEIQSLIFYILAGLKRYSNLSIEASLKYFIFGSYASCIMLLGISFLYFSFGTLNFLEINKLLIDSLSLSSINNNNSFFLVGIILFISALFFKIAVFPFHV